MWKVTVRDLAEAMSKYKDQDISLLVDIWDLERFRLLVAGDGR